MGDHARRLRRERASAECSLHVCRGAAPHRRHPRHGAGGADRARQADARALPHRGSGHGARSRWAARKSDRPGAAGAPVAAGRCLTGPARRLRELRQLAPGARRGPPGRAGRARRARRRSYPARPPAAHRERARRLDRRRAGRAALALGASRAHRARRVGAAAGRIRPHRRPRARLHARGLPFYRSCLRPGASASRRGGRFALLAEGGRARSVRAGAQPSAVGARRHGAGDGAPLARRSWPALAQLRRRCPSGSTPRASSLPWSICRFRATRRPWSKRGCARASSLRCRGCRACRRRASPRSCRSRAQSPTRSFSRAALRWRRAKSRRSQRASPAAGSSRRCASH